MHTSAPMLELNGVFSYRKGRALSMKQPALSPPSPRPLPAGLRCSPCPAPPSLPAHTPPSPSPHQQAQQLETRVFTEIGPGFFDSDDFEVLQQLGRISVMRVRGGGRGGEAGGGRGGRREGRHGGRPLRVGTRQGEGVREGRGEARGRKGRQREAEGGKEFGNGGFEGEDRAGRI